MALLIFHEKESPKTWPVIHLTLIGFSAINTNQREAEGKVIEP